MRFHRLIVRSAGFALALGLAALLNPSACSSNGGLPASDDAGMSTGEGGGGNCAQTPADENYSGCATCTFSSTADPATCSAARPVDACCAWVAEPPTTGLSRAVGLHYNSVATASAPDFGCLTTPIAVQPSTMVTLTGYVKLFADGQASAGVKIEIFKEGTNGALGASIGTYTTASTDPYVLSSWSSKCNTPGCNLYTYSIPNVPTYTPLIMKTSDATGSGMWADLYDYNIYISDPTTFGTTDPACKAGTAGTPMGGAVTAPPCYNATAVAATDINTVASSAVGTDALAADGVLAGEVHDCGDIRIAGATVDTDQAHGGYPLFYFNTTEDDPLPDLSNASTSDLGLFGALNLAPGVPTRISATGYINGTLTMLGTYVVQLYPGAVTVLSLRGRRPYQTSP